MLGSFSKIVAPSFRVGWLVAQSPLMEKLVIAKQATDLHTSEFVQRIIYQYLIDNDLDAHIESIRQCYGDQCQAMLAAIQAHFPSECRYTRPEGGMFLWLSLPEQQSAMALFERAIKHDVAFVPGDPFYTHDRPSSALRLNFSCSDGSEIEEGIRRLAASL
jgi:2-aminoadipate transaminase